MNNREIIEKQSNKKIVLGTVLGYVALGISVLSGLFFTRWIKDSLGTSMYGIYTLAQSIVNLFLLDFGLSNSINAFVSRYRAEGKIKDEEAFLTATLKIYLCLDAILLFVFVAVYFCIEFIYVGLTSSEISVLKNVFIILTGFSILTFPSSVFGGILKAYEEFGWIKIIEISNKLVYIILTAVSLMLNWGIYAVIFSYAFSSFVNALLLFLFSRFKLKKRINVFAKTKRGIFKQIVSFSGFGFLNSISSRLIFTIAPSILGVVSDSTNIAVFGVCSSLEGYVYSFSNVMSGFFMPKISRIGCSRKDFSFGVKINSLAIKIGKIQAAIVMLIVLGFVAVGGDFINVWMHYDQTYNIAYAGTIMLITYQVVYSAQTIFTTSMNSDKETIKPYSIAVLICSFFNIGFLFAFGYFFGSFGACVGIFLTHVIELICSNVLYKKYLHVSLKDFFKNVYLGFLPSVIITLIVALSFHFLLPFDSLTNIFIGGFGTVVVYLAFVWIGFGKDDTKRFLLSLKGFLLKKKKEK